MPTKKNLRFSPARYPVTTRKNMPNIRTTWSSLALWRDSRGHLQIPPSPAKGHAKKYASTNLLESLAVEKDTYSPPPPPPPHGQSNMKPHLIFNQRFLWNGGREHHLSSLYWHKSLPSGEPVRRWLCLLYISVIKGQCTLAWSKKCGTDKAIHCSQLPSEP